MKIMKRLSMMLASLLITCYSVYGQEIVKEDKLKKERVYIAAKNDSADVYSEVAVKPEFPGGEINLMKFLAKNVTLSKTAYENKLSGTTIVKFIIDTEGSIHNVKVERAFLNCPDCDEEAVRAISRMPKWKPGKMASGEIINVYYTLPVKIIVR
jgi:TonB family protein